MGCVSSKLEEEEVVTVCRERKRQLMLAVERRYALAEAHCKYFHSLYAVAAAIKLFVARHSSPSSPFLITLPPPSCPSPPPLPTQNVINNPMFLQQTASESKHETVSCETCASSTTSEEESSEEEEREEKVEVEREKEQVQVEQQPCGYYYMHMPMPMSMPPSMPSPQRDFGWDFFNPFDGVRTDVIGGVGYRRNSDDDLRVVREEEGIPELEEEVEREELDEKVVKVEENEGEEQVSNAVETVKVVDTVGEKQEEEKKGLTVLDTPEEGRELLDALKDIEDYFVRAYDSGKDVTRMLEANRIPLQSSLEEIKGGFLEIQVSGILCFSVILSILLCFWLSSVFY